MKELFYVTSNRDKLAIARKTLEKLEIKVNELDIETPEIQSLDSEVVAQFSAEWAANETGKQVIKHDSGFHIKALNGFPGALVKFFNQQLSIEQIIGLYKNSEDKSAYFKEAIAYCAPREKPKTFVHFTYGKLIDTPAEITKTPTSNKYKVNEIFIPDGYKKRLVEFTQNEWSNLWDYDRFKGFTEFIENNLS